MEFARRISAWYWDRMRKKASLSLLVVGVLALIAWCCSGSSERPTPPPPPTPSPTVEPPPPAIVPGQLPADLPRGLLIATSQFQVENGVATARPGPARLEIVTRRGGEWHTEVLEDQGSNVFHKAMVYEPPGAAPGIVTLGGMAAACGS